MESSDIPASSSVSDLGFSSLVVTTTAEPDVELTVAEGVLVATGASTLTAVTFFMSNMLKEEWRRLISIKLISMHHVE